VAASATSDDVRHAALTEPKVVELLDGAEPRKVIVVPGRLVNVVI
jgi:leucyl-tRNA synthetase